jgi:hypothetical protein
MLGFYPIFTFMWILVYYLSTIQYNFFMSKFMVPYFEKTYHSAQMMLFLAGSFLFCRGDSANIWFLIKSEKETNWTMEIQVPVK